MKTKKIELFIQARKYNWQENFKISVNLWEFKTDDKSIYITLDKKIIDIEIPELDEKLLTLAHVEQLRDQIKSEKAASYLRVIKMEDEINSLMCIENKVDE